MKTKNTNQFYKKTVLASLILANMYTIPPALSNEALTKTSKPQALNLLNNSVSMSDHWILVWSDEFNEPQIDSNKWNLEENCWGGGNNEQQCYTDKASNAFIKNGILNIVAKKESFTGSAYSQYDKEHKNNNKNHTLPYTSARLNTLNKGDWKYGRFDIRAKLPSGQGTWPAIWMLPTDWVYGGWAASGEIDIMEAINLKTPSTEIGATKDELESRVFATLHYGQAWPNNIFTGQAAHLPNNLNPADDFHIYSIEWEEGEIRWYIDNVHFATQKDNGWYSQHIKDGKLVSGGKLAPFNQRFHLLLNLAVGGSWAANANNTGIDNRVFPQTLSIDYVRIYQCSLNPETGKGCAVVSKHAKTLKGTPEPNIVKASARFAQPPLFNILDNELVAGIAYDSYDPDNSVEHQLISEEQRDAIWRITKSGDIGNVYLKIAKTDLSAWAEEGELVFDLNIESRDNNADLLIKMDSGWPNTSDIRLTQLPVNQWQEVRIKVADFIKSDNSYSPGNKINIKAITNILVIEPTGKMILKLDNIRLEI